MSIKGATISIVESQDSIQIKQDDASIIVLNINDINVMLDTLARLKSRYYISVSKNVYVNSNERQSAQ